MFSPKGFIKKFRNTEINPQNKTETNKVKIKTKNRKTIKYDSDESVKSALVEICIYILFLVVATIVANAAHNLYMFYYNQTLERSFIGHSTHTKFGSEMMFEELVTTADWWIYLETNFLDKLHGIAYEANNIPSEMEDKEHDEEIIEVEKPKEMEDDKKEIDNENLDNATPRKLKADDKIDALEEKDTKGINKKRETDKNENGENYEENEILNYNEKKNKTEAKSPDLEKEAKNANEDDNKINKDDQLQQLYLRENLLLGPPRLRQIRVQENSCQVHELFVRYFRSCYAGYSEGNENRTKIYKGTQFYTMSELKVNKIRGEITTYYGAGNVKDLTFEYEKNQQILQNLKEIKWIDRGTRIVIVEFVLFNANVLMLQNAKIIAEITPVGGIVPSHQFQSLKLHSIFTEGNIGLYIAAGIFYLMMLYYTVEEFIQCFRIGAKKYFISLWNILDITVLILAYLSLIYNIVHPIYLFKLIKKIRPKSNDFVSIDYICYWNLLYIDMMGILVFLVWIKIFKYISFNKTMLQFSTTLRRCAKDLFGFAVMFFIVFLAYAQLGLLIFGTSHPDFREFGISVITLMRMFLGDFEYHLIEEANHILGPIYFLTYVLFVFFILLNMFLAIINDTYGAVKSEVKKGRSNFGLYLAKIFRQIFSICFNKSDLINSQISSEPINYTDGVDEVYPSTSANVSQPVTSGRVLKSEDEVLREYFEELPDIEEPVPSLQEISKENYERLNNRITLLEEVLEQLITNMDRILNKIESKRFNKSKH